MTILFRSVFLGLFLLGASGAQAQSIAIHNDAVWHEAFWLYDGLTVHQSTFTCSADGDTLIDGLVHTRIHQLGVDSISTLGSADPAVAVPLDRYLGAIRVDEVERRWYVYFDGYPNELLLYDFDLTVGATTLGIWGDCGVGFTVNAMDSVLLGSTWHDRYHLDLPGRFIIEGVGSSAGLFGQLCQFFEEFSCLHMYEQPGALLPVDGCGTLNTSIASAVHTGQQALAYPNPTTGLVYLLDVPELGAVEVHDGLGRPVMQAMRTNVGTAIDLSTLAAGHYTVRVGAWVGRVVKE
ncbi:MAG: T9SS type A sorting domain-containing protein [Flavobacteriales bacterium]|nr:T9SS type A sorting domain-containing protein [Flavobacteriales bacterium]